MMRSLLLTASLLVGTPAMAQPAPVPDVVVLVNNFHFAPAAIRLAAGRPVRLSFNNESGSAHDFTAREFFRHASGVQGPVRNGQVALPPHSSTSVTLTPTAGKYDVKCSHFGHRMLGMAGSILVD